MTERRGVGDLQNEERGMLLKKTGNMAIPFLVAYWSSVICEMHMPGSTIPRLLGGYDYACHAPFALLNYFNLDLN